jgi:competence protein ComEA
MKKEKIKEHLRFSFKERIGFVVILLIIAIVFSYPFLFDKKEEQPLAIVRSSDAVNRNINENNTGDSAQSFPHKSYASEHEPKKEIKLFYFDPNTASEEQWQSLGLRDRTIRTIKNYLSKGGSFKAKEDLKKIYGLHEDEYARLEPYVRIELKEETKSAPTNSSSNKFYAKPVYKTETSVINDINSADVNAFIALPGIGEKLAGRIINFRDKLGGFYAVEQVKETYGLPDSTFQMIRQYLKLNTGVKKININTASKEDLKSHPYIRWNLANAIVEYRNQHGAFKTLEELKNIVVIDETTYKKTSPYLIL